MHMNTIYAEKLTDDQLSLTRHV